MAIHDQPTFGLWGVPIADKSVQGRKRVAARGGPTRQIVIEDKMPVPGV
jgi:hypothetical protein